MGCEDEDQSAKHKVDDVLTFGWPSEAEVGASFSFSVQQAWKACLVEPNYWGPLKHAHAHARTCSGMFLPGVLCVMLSDIADHDVTMFECSSVTAPVVQACCHVRM